jgi:hypothetical protein
MHVYSISYACELSTDYALRLLMLLGLEPDRLFTNGLKDVKTVPRLSTRQRYGRLVRSLSKIMLTFRKKPLTPGLPPGENRSDCQNQRPKLLGCDQFG